ncbi:MAG: hypothetical protein HY392_01375 [Candidatus Diapherotrites archaeon]|nr:hypothetical protein [Candidatus Diapherotrites archaeon]
MGKTKKTGKKTGKFKGGEPVFFKKKSMVRKKPARKKNLKCKTKSLVYLDDVLLFPLPLLLPLEEPEELEDDLDELLDICILPLF